MSFFKYSWNTDAASVSVLWLPYMPNPSRINYMYERLSRYEKIRLLSTVESFQFKNLVPLSFCKVPYP